MGQPRAFATDVSRTSSKYILVESSVAAEGLPRFSLADESVGGWLLSVMRGREHWNVSPSVLLFRSFCPTTVWGTVTGRMCKDGQDDGWECACGSSAQPCMKRATAHDRRQQWAAKDVDQESRVDERRGKMCMGRMNLDEVEDVRIQAS